jgi:hypothetical protein
MPGELLTELIFRPLFEILGYFVGKPVVRLLSLGRLHTSLDAEPDPAAKRKRWSSITFVRDGKRYVSAEFVSLVGIIFLVLVIAAIVLVIRRI